MIECGEIVKIFYIAFANPRINLLSPFVKVESYRTESSYPQSYPTSCCTKADPSPWSHMRYNCGTFFHDTRMAEHNPILDQDPLFTEMFELMG